MSIIVTKYIILLLTFIIWTISEIIIMKNVKNSKNNDSIWLAINIILPVVGCVIYKLTHKKISEQ